MMLIKCWKVFLMDKWPWLYIYIQPGLIQSLIFNQNLTELAAATVFNNYRQEQEAKVQSGYR